MTPHTHRYCSENYQLASQYQDKQLELYTFLMENYYTFHSGAGCLCLSDTMNFILVTKVNLLEKGHSIRK